MKTIKIGVFGAGRGVALAQDLQKLGAEIVALCDNHKGRIKDGLRRLDRTEEQVKLFDNFDDFISYLTFILLLTVLQVSLGQTMF